MTITTNPTRNEYTAIAAQTIFDYTFKIFDSTDLDVYQTPVGQDPDDSSDLITAYSVTGVGNEGGGTIILNTGATAGDLITIVSSIPENRTTDYQNNGDFLPDTVNDDFDRVVSLVKQLSDTVDRGLTFQQSEQGAGGLTLPSPISQNFIRWKTDLSGFENVPSTVSNVLIVTALSEFTDLADAVSSIGSSDAELWIDKDDTLAASLTIPKNITLRSVKGNIITTGVFTLTINGQFDAGLYQTFDTSGGGDIAFGDEAVKAVYPQWWGFSEDATAINNRVHLQNAVDSLVAGGKIKIPAGVYAFDLTVSMNINVSGLVLSGDSMRSTKLQCTGSGTAAIYMNSSALPDGSEQKYDISIENIWFEQQSQGNGTGILLRDVSHGRVENCKVDAFGTGINFVPRDSCRIVGCSFDDNDTAISAPEYFTTIGSENYSIESCEFSENNTWAIDIGSDINGAYISKCFFDGASGGEGITVSTGEDDDSNNLTIEDCEFVNFDSGSERCIYIENTNSRLLTGLTIRSCNFRDPEAFAVTVEKSSNVTLDTCIFAQTAAGSGRAWSFDLDCSAVQLRNLSESDATNVDGTSQEVSRIPNVVFLTPETSADYFGDSFSTGDTTVDVSTSFTGIPLVPKPKGYNIRVVGRDSGSAAGTPSLELKKTAAISNVQSLLLNVSSLPNDSQFGAAGFVECDANGDFVMTITASGVLTFDVWINIVGIVY